MRFVATITGYEMCTIAGETADLTFQKMRENVGLTSSSDRGWTVIPKIDLCTTDSIYLNLELLVLKLLKKIDYWDGSKLSCEWKQAKKGLVCGSNFWETNIWENQIKDKNMINMYNNSMFKLSKVLKIDGVTMAVSTACSSGASALVTGCQLIESGEVDIVLVGGYDFRTQIPENGMRRIRALSNDQIRPFSKDRTGTDLAEGIGFLILENPEFAASKRKKVPAHILGYGVGSDAYSVTAPDPEGIALEKAMENAIRYAAIRPEDIDYINSHGSGTPLNDSIETKVIHKIFKEHAADILVNSSKSILGHTLGAAGIIESIITIQALEQGIVHGTSNYNEQDEECDLNYCVEGAVAGDFKYALSNSIGFGGTNVSIVFAKGDIYE